MKYLGASKFKLNVLIFLISALVCFEVPAATAPLCAHVFSAKITPEIQTFINHTVQALAELRLSVERAQVSGTSTVVRTAMANNLQQKEKQLVEYVEKNGFLTPARLSEMIKEAILKTQKKLSENSAKESIPRAGAKVFQELAPYRQAVLHRIQPHNFEAKWPDGLEKISLNQPFEMAKHLTTQTIWKAVVEVAQERYPGKYIFLDPHPSKFTGDALPVESISYGHTQEWLNALNELSAQGDPALAGIIQGHQRGDVYRLPTSAEWDFVASGAGKLYDRDFDAFSWNANNSEIKTQPVGTKEALLLQDKPFYDMVGNVSVWISDSSVTANVARFRGGTMVSPAEGSFLFQRSAMKKDKLSPSVGFRLVRDIP